MIHHLPSSLRLLFLLQFIPLASPLATSPKPFNFGAATPRLPLLFGVEAPGVPLKPDGRYNTPQSVPLEVVDEWTSFLRDNHNVKRTLCLLKPEELACYENPGYEELLRERGMTPVVVNVFEEGAKDKCQLAYEEAERAGERLAVHCSGGEGRTGLVLGALMMEG